MSEISLSTSAKKTATTELVVKLTNTDTGELQSLMYEVAKLTGRAAMDTQLAIAEFARQENGQAIVGSMMVRTILDGTKPLDGAPDFLSLFDTIDTDAVSALIGALVAAATSSTVGE